MTDEDGGAAKLLNIPDLNLSLPSEEDTMRRWSLALVLVALVLAGCASVGQHMAGKAALAGSGVEDSQLRKLGCDPAQVEQVAESIRQAGNAYRLPDQGDSHCTVLGKMGSPTGFGEFGASESMIWEYRPAQLSRYSPSDPTVFVHLARGDSLYRVTSVDRIDGGR